jgi:acetolactate synthase I/II/III large subunit
VDKVLEAAMQYSEGPCLIDAEVVREDNVFPMIPAGAALADIIIDPPKAVLEKPAGST